MLDGLTFVLRHARIEDYPPEAESMLDTVPLGSLALPLDTDASEHESGLGLNHTNASGSTLSLGSSSEPHLTLDARDLELRPNVLPPTSSARTSLDSLSSTSTSFFAHLFQLPQYRKRTNGSRNKSSLEAAGRGSRCSKLSPVYGRRGVLPIRAFRSSGRRTKSEHCFFFCEFFFRNTASFTYN